MNHPAFRMSFRAHWLLASILLLVVALLLVLRVVRTLAYNESKPMHWSSLVVINLSLLYVGVIIILRHPAHIWLASISWLTSWLIFFLYSFFRTMKIHVKLNKNNNILVPVFLFKILLFIIVPYAVIYYPMILWKPQLYQYPSFVLFIMIFKGCIAGIYLGSTVACIYQVYERDMPDFGG